MHERRIITDQQRAMKSLKALLEQAVGIRKEKDVFADNRVETRACQARVGKPQLRLMMKKMELISGKA